MLVATHHSLYVTSIWSKVRNNGFNVDNMKQLFQDIHIDSIMICLKEMNLFNKI